MKPHLVKLEVLVGCAEFFFKRLLHHNRQCWEASQRKIIKTEFLPEGLKLLSLKPFENTNIFALCVLHIWGNFVMRQVNCIVPEDFRALPKGLRRVKRELVKMCRFRGHLQTIVKTIKSKIL